MSTYTAAERATWQTEEFVPESFTKAVQKAAEAMGSFARRIEGLAEHFEAFVIEERCDYSDLFESQCAHCLGHVADFDPPKKVVVYGP